MKHARTAHYLTGKWSDVSTRVEQNAPATLFIAPMKDKLDHNSECRQTLHVTIPRSQHHEPSSIEAKRKELANFVTYDVYEIVDKPSNVKIIGTQWVIVDKDIPGKPEPVRKARLTMRGDQEETEEIIHSDSPTVNSVNIKLMLIEAVRKGWKISSSDVTRAFLQTSKINRDVYVYPPKEAGLPRSKVWRLKRPAYGLIDAAHAFFINFGDSLISLGCETSKMDNATFYHYSDGSKPGDDKRNLDGIVGSHIDDFLEVSDETMKRKVLDEVKKKFTFGSHEDIDKTPFRYVGLNLRKEDDNVIIDQDHLVEQLEAPDMKEISSMKKEDKLPEKFQTVFRSLVSKLNMFSMTARPDITFDVKSLTTKYGKALKLDLMLATKLLKKVKRMSTQITIPDMGEVKDWILVAYSDAATKKIDNAFSVAGHVIFLVNSVTNNSVPITWGSKKIERVVNSSLGAETIAVTKIIGNLYFIKESLKQMYGTKAGDIPCITLIDSKDLHEAVHNIKTTQDKRLIGDIIQIKQAIAIDNLITELRLIPGDDMLANCLTKGGQNGTELIDVLRNGALYIPGGKQVQSSMKIHSSTWRKLIEAQSESFQSIHD